MSLKRWAFNTCSGLLKGGIKLIGGQHAPTISASLAELLSPLLTQETEVGAIRFFCPGRLPEWRARTLLTKEPETLEWIHSFQANDTMWDVGANVGVYSLYAARAGARVVAFEPSPSNYYVLSRNLEINELEERVSALCIAFHDRTCLDSFFMVNTELGAALNSFGQAVDCSGRDVRPAFKQAMLGYSIDDFVNEFDPPFPNHIKIDVDGNEDKVIEGATVTLADPRLKTLLVELNTGLDSYLQRVVALLEDAGMVLERECTQPEGASPEAAQVYNHIFVRRRD